jgi:hypothetical protein
MVTAGDVIAE